MEAERARSRRARWIAGAGLGAAAAIVLVVSAALGAVRGGTSPQEDGGERAVVAAVLEMLGEEGTDDAALEAFVLHLVTEAQSGSQQ